MRASKGSHRRFSVDEKQHWPPEKRESFRLSEASEDGSYTPELAAEVNRNVKSLREFKSWIGGLRFRGEFSKPEHLKMPIALALTKKEGGVAADASKYLTWLRGIPDGSTYAAFRWARARGTGSRSATCIHH